MGTIDHRATEAGPGRRSGETRRGLAGERTTGLGPGAIDDDAGRDDASRLYLLVVFESQEKARARENDERRQEPLVKVRTLMGEIFDGAPEFADLDIVEEWTP